MVQVELDSPQKKKNRKTTKRSPGKKYNSPLFLWRGSNTMKVNWVTPGSHPVLSYKRTKKGQ
jgi:hypothetical protein